MDFFLRVLFSESLDESICVALKYLYTVNKSTGNARTKTGVFCVHSTMEPSSHPQTLLHDFQRLSKTDVSFAVFSNIGFHSPSLSHPPTDNFTKLK